MGLMSMSNVTSMCGLPRIQNLADRPSLHHDAMKGLPHPRFVGTKLAIWEELVLPRVIVSPLAVDAAGVGGGRRGYAGLYLYL